MSKKPEANFNTSSTCWYFPMETREHKIARLEIEIKDLELQLAAYQRGVRHAEINIDLSKSYMINMSGIREKIKNTWFTDNKSYVTQLMDHTKEFIKQEVNSLNMFNKELERLSDKIASKNKELILLMKESSIKPYPYNADKGVGWA